MAPEKKDKKRKATSAAAIPTTDSPNKKSKKASTVEKAPAATPKSILKKKNNVEEKSNGIVKSKKAPETSSEPARKLRPRKRASDFLSDDENDNGKQDEEEEEVEKLKEPVKKQKQSVKNGKEKTEKKGRSSKSKKVEVVAEDEEELSEAENGAEEEEVEEEDDEIDDQTAELIRGFESSGDEDASEDEGFDADKPVPRIPVSKTKKSKVQKETNEPEKPGTVYVGRIPHGFYEHQMRSYFTQFGDITRLRLSRNRVTGRSKHYAFIEFASLDVAKIVAETMNNYLMYGHILKCKFVPQEQLHPELWKGANRRYRRIPWNRVEKQRLDRGKTREKWTRSIEQEKRRRSVKAKKLKELGYEFEMPKLKAIDQVPVQEAPAAIEEKKDTTSGVGATNSSDHKENKTVSVAG